MPIVIPQCPICFETFDEHGHHPRIAWRCGHDFCHTCMSAIQASAADNQQEPTCPVCRAPITASPPNHTLIAMIAQVEVMNSSQK